MWTVVYIAHCQKTSQALADKLIENGMLAKVRQSGNTGNGNAMYEVIVPETEVEDAAEILGSFSSRD